MTRSVDSMLEALRNKKGEKPRLVHRLDRDTSGVLVVARTRLAAMKLAEACSRARCRKTYWALVRGVPRKHEDKISTWMVKEQTPDGDRMRRGQTRRGGSRSRGVLLPFGRKCRPNLGLAGDGAAHRPAPINCVCMPPTSDIPSSAIPNISRPTRTGIFRRKCKIVCTCMRVGSSSRIPTAASSM